MKLSSTFCLLIVCFAAMQANAASYWVLGSYSDKRNAVEQQTNLHDAIGETVSLISIQVNGKEFHRLLLAASTYSDDIQSVLEVKKIKPWKVNADIQSTAPPAVEKSDEPKAASKRFYLVAGSYSEVTEALALESDLGKSIDRVTSQTIIVRGKVYHRVVVGPLGKGSLSIVRELLKAHGVSKPWLLNAADEVSKDFEQESIEILLTVPAKSYQTTSYQSKKEILPRRVKSGGYNLAKLGPRSSPFAGKKMGNGRWYLETAFEQRTFFDEGLNLSAKNRNKNHSSVQVQAEYTRSWNDENDLFTFVPFYRWDAEDEDRSHFDIRELSWVHVFDNWELRTGIRKVYWGVTEAQHLVDIVNQTDNLENINGEEKLGQPMINLSWTSEWGIFDAYLLLGFREREYVGINGRPRFPFLVDADLSLFESGAKEYRSDFAFRWSQYFGELELALSHFSGTSREPVFDTVLRLDDFNRPIDGVLIPRYDVIDQTGLDAQYFIGDWAWKLEAISRSGQGDRFSAYAFGFEKTIVGIFDSRADLGIVAEYLRDNRQSPVIADDDFALGFRLSLNDASDSTALLVFLKDNDSSEMLTTLEASMRLGTNWKLIIDATLFSGSENIESGLIGILESLNNQDEEIGLFQDEDFVKIELTRYF